MLAYVLLNPFGTVIQTLEFVFCVTGQASDLPGKLTPLRIITGLFQNDIERQILVASGSREDRAKERGKT